MARPLLQNISCCGKVGVEYDWGSSENRLMRGCPRKTECQEFREDKFWAAAYNGIGWWMQMFWKLVVATFWSVWRRMEELCNGENTPFGIFNADGERRKSSPVSIPAPAPRMSLSTIPIDPVLLNDGGTHFRSFEEIQYLSRQVYHAPPMPVAALNVSGPISTVQDFTARQWTKYIDRQPLDVDPTFAVAPQSEYHGSVELPDGQILHRSSAANVLRIFRDRATGRPYTLACHEFTFHLAAPNDPQKEWQLELCYPSDARMKAAMEGMAPAGALERGEVTFPKHATKERPPMFPLFKRARVDLKTYRNQELPENMFRLHAVRENEFMNERPAVLNPMLVSMPTVIKSEEKEGLEAVAGVRERLKEESVGRECDQFVLRLERGSSSPTDSDGSMPELEEADSTSDIGICPYCFGCQHVSMTECPLQGISEATANQLIGLTYPERQGACAFLKQLQCYTNAPLLFAPAFLIKWLESHSSDILLLPDQSPAVLRRAFEDFVKQDKNVEEDEEKKPPADPHIAIDRTSASPSVFRAGNLSAAACVVPPSFPRRGRIVTRETWSSSSPSPQDSTDESFEFVRRTRDPPPDESTSLEPTRWSPLISHWIHELTGNDPSESDISSSSNSAVFSSASSSSSMEDHVVDPLQRVPQYNPPPGGMAELHTALYYWAYDGALRQIDTRRYEDEKGSEPAELALRVGFAVRPPTPFRLLTPLLTPVENLFTIPDGPLDSSALFTPDSSDSSGPNPTQSPTSLDFSLPSPLKAEPLPQEDFLEQEARVELSAMGRQSGSKRKAPDDQKGRRQRTFSKFAGEFLRKSTVSRAAFKATGILDADVIRKFAGVRLATIETARRMEDIVWKLYGISEQSFPTKPARHPLLHEYELAKMYTVLDVLRRNGRFRLANNLHNLLSIRLRDDYAVSQLLNARFLDANYPEFGEDYHELLRDANEVSVPPSGTIPDYFPVDERESGTDSEMPEYSDEEDYEESQGWSRFRAAHSV
ncbi:hypothetical protein DFH08DRAFT_903251 [Mycena albidolilacea]|uniref:Uncharacterized protein n=1 Tax=Mycena albidolilacea TaxID=1033008 RepID=A0AAD7EA89_9AGAR|nr:hypothetical protein DFH08DRAFT_903251 [Mycena albidolilacea]